jgi:hypothetical protein
MPEEVRKDLEKWEEKTKNFMTKIRNTEKKAVKGLRNDAKALAQEGKAIVAKIDKKMEKAEEKAKDALKKLRERTVKGHEDLSKTWFEATGDHLGEPIE